MKHKRSFILGLFSLLLISITTTSFSYDVIRSKQKMEESKKNPPATSAAESKPGVKAETAKPPACTCSDGVLIDVKNPASGYIYHCQCGNLECAITQSHQDHAKGKTTRPPLYCK